MYKLKLFLLPVAWLLAFMALACAPPDDDAPSSGPSGPTINNAIYDFATALLTVQGTDLSPTSVKQAQIQTIRVGSRTNGVAFSAYTADAKPTGVNSNGLEQGKYRIKSDGTKLWLKLKDEHKAALEAKVGSNGLKKGLLSVGTGAWAGLNIAKDLTVRNIPDKPSEQAEQAEQAEEESPKQSKDEQAEQAEQAEEQSPKQSKDEQVEQAEQAEEESPKQSKDEQAEQAEQAEEQSPKQSKDEQAEQVEQAEEQSPKQAKDEQDEQAEQVEQAEEESPELPDPAITRVTYNVISGVLEITGTNLPAAVADWDFSKLTLVSGDGTRYTLPRHSTLSINVVTGSTSRILSRNTATGSRASATELFIQLRGSVKAEAEKILVNDGDSDANGAYNLEAAAGFAGGSAADTTNPITVSGHTARIISATYDANTGVLLIAGIRLPKTVAGWDFSKLTLVSGDGTRYTLPEHATAGENTATGSRAFIDSITITLSGSVKAEAEKILVKTGDSDDNGAYNLEAAAEFVTGSPEDTSNPITVSGYVSLLDSVLYRATRGLLYISGSRLPTTVADWNFSKLTIVSGDGSKRYTLPEHATAGTNKATGSSASATSLIITLSGNVKAKVNAILVKAGFGDANGAYNLEAAAEFVPGSPEDPTTGIQVVNY